MYIKNGFLEIDELDERLPSEERLEKGAVAVLECIQQIPCNPCQDACSRGAIQPFESMNDTPTIDMEKCNGCGNCIAACPGLAIFVVWKHYSAQTSLVKLPYELLPLPEIGEIVFLLNRQGEIVGEGKIVKVQKTKQNPKSKILWVETPKDMMMEVRHITRRES